MVNFSIYALLGLLEVMVLLLVLGAVLFFEWRSAKKSAAVLQQRLAEVRAAKQEEASATARTSVGNAGETVPEREYADFLRDQIDQSSVLLGEDIAAAAQGALDTDGMDEDDIERQMLAARHQFLQLELDVQAAAAERDVDTQRKRIVQGMRALLDGLQLEDDPDEPLAESGADSDSPRAQRTEEDKLRDQITYLRSVIDNQHAVMQELRGLLEEHDGDSGKLQSALDKLSLAEHQSANLKKRLKEIERGKLEGLVVGGAKASASAQGGSSPDTDMLKDLVGNQQRTIQNLQQMLKKIVPEGDKAKEFTSAIDKIQRTNNELNSCVMILEDENSTLRSEVEELQQRISDLEAQVDVPSAAVPAPAVEQSGPDAAADEAADMAADSSDVELNEGAEPDQATSAERPSPSDAPAAAMADEPAVDDIDAMLEAAAGAVPGSPDQGEAGSAESEPMEEPPQVTSVTAGAAEQDDIDALLDAAAKPAAPPAAEEKAAEESPAKIKSITEGASDQDDIDALLSDLFGEASADKDSKSN